jgi:hypothetical protein
MTPHLLLSQSDGPFTQILADLTALPAWRPFDTRLVNFVGKLSQLLLSDRRVREFPEFAALGHWFRKARLNELSRQLDDQTIPGMRIGRGLAFHLAPANVDSVFMYSWLLSLLAGNTNIIRVSQKGGDQLDFIIEILRKICHQDEFGDVARRFVILTYPHDRALTQEISEACMVRVIWGGDTTVREIRAIPLRPMATEMCFADRFSAAAMDAAAILKLDDKGFGDLIHGFYVDTFWFGQQACSSPRLVAWIGSEQDIQAAQARFWSRLEIEVRHQQSENSPGMVMARLGALFEFAAEGLGSLPLGTSLSNFPATLDLSRPELDRVRQIHCGNGLFVQVKLQSLQELGPHLRDKDQTLAVFGFTRSDFEALVACLPARALDRITPVGNALTFDPIWDGQDLLVSLTRIITLPNHPGPDSCR